MFQKLSLIALTYAAVACAQQIGTNTAESHPALTWQKCTASSCTTVSGSVVLDANWRWTHNVGGSTNCYTGNTWDTTLCPDDVTCAANCALDGANYASTYGVTTSGNALTIKFVTQSSGKNIGSRLYLMADTTHYETFNVLNQEFTFDVDVSQLPCGLNGALYFSEMAADGGISSTNKAGAQYGTGYCDSQCPRDIKFIAGKANSDGWVPDSNSANTGKGNNGACCNEMDIWEANSISAAYTPHPCSATGLTVCSGTACGSPSTGRYNTVCDPDGCDFNSYRNGNATFYGPGMTVNTNSKFTVVTQFVTTTGTASGTLNQINRFYVQNGVVIPNSFTSIPGVTATNSVNTNYCTQQAAAFQDTTTSFLNKGGLPQISKSMANGMVLVLSLWDDYFADMLWLDSTYPTNSTTAGSARGTCATTSGVPATVEAASPNAQVIYSNIRFGDIGSTFGTGPGGSSTGTATTNPSTTATGTTSASGATQTHYGQCGGIGWTGPTACASGTTCQVSNPYYSQCL
jgi:cellulose 1,4-beta-cellobiosidase